MKPKRIFKMARNYNEIEGSPKTFTVEEPSPIDGGKIRHKSQYGRVVIHPGGWDVADPNRVIRFHDGHTETGYFPTDRKGNPQLFVARPSTLVQLYATKGITKRSVAHLLGLANQEAKKHGTGTLTYSDDLSEYSAPLVLNAVRRGDVEENPDFTEHDLRRLVEDHAWLRSNYTESDHRAAISDRQAEDEDTARMHHFFTNEDEFDVTDLPENAGETAYKEARDAGKRSIAKQELPEPSQQPVKQEGNLWDHASNEDKQSWSRLEQFSQAKSSHYFHD